MPPKDLIPKPVDVAVLPDVPVAPANVAEFRALAEDLAVPALASVDTRPAAVTIGGDLARPVSTGGSYRVAHGSTEREHVVKPPTGADPTRDPEAARPRPPDTPGT